MRQALCAVFVLTVCIWAKNANAIDHEPLREADKPTLTGKRLKVLTHAARDIGLAGNGLIADRDQAIRTANLLGLDDDQKLTALWDGGTIASTIPVTDVDDPAPGIAKALGIRLAAAYGLSMSSDVDDSQPLPATSVPDGLGRKAYVARIVESGQSADLLLDVQTITWQITRPSRFYGTWFNYYARMMLVDPAEHRVLASWECTKIQRFGSRKLIPLPEYLGNDKAMLRADAHEAGKACEKQFSDALGLASSE